MQVKMTSNEYLELVDKYAKQVGRYPVHYVGEWNGYHIFEPDLYYEPVCIGYPLVIMEKDLNFKISTPDESLEIMNFFNSEEGVEFEEE